MIDFGKVLNTLFITIIIGGFLAFVDFQVLKSKVNVIASDVFKVQQDVSAIDDVRTVSCKLALHILDDKKDILDICR